MMMGGKDGNSFDRQPGWGGGAPGLGPLGWSQAPAARAVQDPVRQQQAGLPLVSRGCSFAGLQVH
jgi:hypothetical protein